MSIYGPRIQLPKISMPNFNLPKIKLPKPNFKIILIILIIVLLIASITFIVNIIPNFSNPISVNWKDNPLYLSEDLTKSAELELTIFNNTKITKNIDLKVITKSKEIIIFCPDKLFPNVSPEKWRKTTCIIRRNPNEKIFDGTYEIEINTNIGKTKTSLEIRK